VQFHPGRDPLMSEHADQQIVYEQPLGERMRAFLRLEHIFARAGQALASADPWSSRTVVEQMIDVLAVTARADMKKELIKELERHAATLGGLARNPRVDPERLHQVLGEVRDTLTTLHACNDLTGATLNDDELFASIRQRSSIPAGTCDFDLPGFHYWLSGPERRRRDDLERWFSTFEVLRTSIALCLRLVRDSAVASREVARAGFYQRTLDHAAPCQLIRVVLPAGTPWYPEISAGRHRFTVRFMHPANGTQRAAQTEADVEFDLLRCVI